jgi:CRP/FNR family transcriptional regulator, anaerobic regulatory protein
LATDRPAHDAWENVLSDLLEMSMLYAEDLDTAGPVAGSEPGDDPARADLCRLFDAALAGRRHDPFAVREISVRAGARLYRTGTQGDAIFVVRSGIIKESVHDRDGAEVIVRLVTPGGVTGLPALVPAPYSHTAVALQPSVVCRVAVHAVQQVRDGQPQLHDLLTRAWNAAVEDADRVIADFGHGRAQARLARLLVFLAHHTPGHRAFVLRRGDAAGLLGVTSVSIARLLRLFKERGWLQVSARRFTVLDPLALLQVAEGRVSLTSDNRAG